MNFAAFFSYVFLVTATPGPNNIMSMANAGKYGFKKSYRFNIGIFCGFMVVLSFCAAFASLLYGFIPTIKPAMLCIGAVYILWLAFSIWRSDSHSDKTGLAQTNTLASGMVLQFVNIKLILFGVTSMSSYVLPYHRSVPVLALVVFCLSLFGFLVTCCWALFGVVFDKLLKKHSKVLNAVMALTLVYCAVSMVLEIWV